MKIKTILETERLLLREFNLDDTRFVLELLNSPNWIEFIGDRGIKSTTDAEGYIVNSLEKSYKENGFGLWLVQLKDSNTPIGMCGLVNRDTLEDIDIGFAMLPNYSNSGYGYESATATLNYAKNTLKITKVIGITDTGNTASIKLLNKIGLYFEKSVKSPEGDTLLVLSPQNNKNTNAEIEALTTAFFSVFTNTGGKKLNVASIKDLFISEGIIINNTNETTEVYTLDEFIAPREKMLKDGTLTNFEESEISNKTEIFENIAHRLSFYKKSGILNGAKFETVGVKTIQFIKVNNNWKISSIAWRDEK